MMWARQTRTSLGLQDGLGVLRSGLVLARYESKPGMRVGELLLPGDVVAEGVFGGDAPSELIAVTPVNLALFDPPQVHALLGRYNGAPAWLLRGMSVRVARAENREWNLKTADARTRLARFLLDWCEATTDIHVPGPFRGGFAQTALAEVVASTRPTVNRILQDFERRGVVVLEHGGVTVEDFAVVRRCARGAASYLHAVEASPAATLGHRRPLEVARLPRASGRAPGCW
jgi:CRP/FNR family cyclic AMP-dependent transcriptional regulator